MNKMDIAQEGLESISVPTTHTAGPARGGFDNANPAGVSFWGLVAEDFETHRRDFFSQGFWALFWHRFGNWRMGLRPKFLRAPMTLIYRVMHKLTQWFCGIDLPFSVVVGRRVRLEHFGAMILIAERIGDDVIIRQNTTFGIAGLDRPRDRPVIANGVSLGAGSVVIGAVTVGEGAIVGANSVVNADVAPYTVVGGVPARVLREIERDD